MDNIDAVEQLNDILVYRDARVCKDQVQYVLIDANECNIEALMDLGVTSEDIDAAELASGGINVAPLALNQLGATWFDPMQWRFVSVPYRDRFQIGYDPFYRLLEHVDRKQLQPDTMQMLSFLESYLALKEFSDDLLHDRADLPVGTVDLDTELRIKRCTWSFDQLCWIVSSYLHRDLHGMQLEGMVPLMMRQVLSRYSELVDVLLQCPAIDLQPVRSHLFRLEEDQPIVQYLTSLQ